MSNGNPHMNCRSGLVILLGMVMVSTGITCREAPKKASLESEMKPGEMSFCLLTDGSAWDDVFPSRDREDRPIVVISGTRRNLYCAVPGDSILRYRFDGSPPVLWSADEKTPMGFGVMGIVEVEKNRIAVGLHQQSMTNDELFFPVIMLDTSVKPFLKYGKYGKQWNHHPISMNVSDDKRYAAFGTWTDCIYIWDRKRNHSTQLRKPGLRSDQVAIGTGPDDVTVLDDEKHQAVRWDGSNASPKTIPLIYGSHPSLISTTELLGDLEDGVLAAYQLTSPPTSQVYRSTVMTGPPAYSRANTQIVVASSGTELCVWSRNTRRVIAEAKCPPGLEVSALHILSDHEVALGTSSGELWLASWK